MAEQVLMTVEKDPCVNGLPVAQPRGAGSPAIQVRAMQLADLPQVQWIDQVSFSLPWPASAYRYELEQNLNSRCWVAEIETQKPDDKESCKTVVGMMVVWLILDEAHIATLAVHPGYRQLGIARRLLVAGLLDAIRRGAVAATLEVRASNWVAQKLYRRFHFEVVGRRVRYYKDNNEDGLIMTVSPLDASYEAWLESEARDENR